MIFIIIHRKKGRSGTFIGEVKSFSFKQKVEIKLNHINTSLQKLNDNNINLNDKKNDNNDFNNDNNINFVDEDDYENENSFPVYRKIKN